MVESRTFAREPVTPTELVLWHNPRCSKSRRALQLLQDGGHTATVFEYLKTAPSPSEIDAVLNRLGIPARELVRTGDALFKELKFDATAATEAQWRELLASHPSLIQRPILVAGERAMIGRPPERVLDIL